MRMTTCLTVVLLLAATRQTARAEDWPQWLGPKRDSVWRETGIVAELPDKLPVKWRAPVELGYAGPAVAAGRVFVCDYVRTTGEITNNYDMSIAAPRQLDHYLFASGIGNVGALIDLNKLARITYLPGATQSNEATRFNATNERDNTDGSAAVVWSGKAKWAVYCCNSTPFLEQGMIYGCQCTSGALVGARLADGERQWETYQPTTGQRRAPHGTAFLVKQDDRFFLFGEQGDLILARLTPAGYQELGRAHLLEPTNETYGRPVVWSHPAFAERCVFARNDKELVCVNLAAQESGQGAVGREQ